MKPKRPLIILGFFLFFIISCAGPKTHRMYSGQPLNRNQISVLKKKYGCVEIQDIDGSGPINAGIIELTPGLHKIIYKTCAQPNVSGQGGAVAAVIVSAAHAASHPVRVLEFDFEPEKTYFLIGTDTEAFIEEENN